LNGRSYLFCIARTWNEARTYCTMRGYDLTIVNDAAEDAWIWSTNVTYNGAVDTWMGLEDMAVNGTYVWVDGTTAWSGGAQTYVDWRNGVPEDLDTEDCIEFDGPSGGQWADGVCSENLPFVCEGPQ
jgi:hypothetical protein